MLGYPLKFGIMDRAEQESVARQVLRDLRASSAQLRPADLLAIIGYWKSRGVRPGEAEATADSDRFHLAASGYRRYQDAIPTSRHGRL